jgi:hypothetical protein
VENKPWHDWDLKLPRWAKLLIFLTCWPAAVLAQNKLIPLHVLENESITVHLMPSPCADPFARRVIRAEKLSQFRAIESNWRMRDGSRQDFAGCWVEEKTETGEDAFFLLFNDGEHFLVLKSEFNRRRGQTGL